MSRILYFAVRTSRCSPNLEEMLESTCKSFQSLGYSASSSGSDENKADFLLLSEAEMTPGNRENKGVVIVTDDESVLADTNSFRSAAECWEMPYDIGAVVLLGERKLFSSRFTGFAFSPLCLVHTESHSSSYRRLASYWIHKSGRKG
ncbi:hypothetical protein [Paenibacillus sp. FJAT-26967]|uniref:hypothetical protein n=1 Tax=Paenibacillus sp. FJAT-26967 TaxID=1729690 RepID=UPI000A014D1A|nr:hypothetical protein [Paenibacillus sp. FJAT-26967]